MLARLSVGQQFYNWVNAQPPEQSYYWRNRAECACGRFLQEAKGYTVQDIKPEVHFGWYSHPDIQQIWCKFNRIAQGDDNNPLDWTFGQLAQRIREKMPECVT
jgi:hypothetical protein